PRAPASSRPRTTSAPPRASRHSIRRKTSTAGSSTKRNPSSGPSSTDPHRSALRERSLGLERLLRLGPRAKPGERLRQRQGGDDAADAVGGRVDRAVFPAEVIAVIAD